jgi:hypothetical protein
LGGDSIDSKTGNFLIDGPPRFPRTLSGGPPLVAAGPTGQDAWAEAAHAGVTFLQFMTPWTDADADAQIAP